MNDKRPPPGTALLPVAIAIALLLLLGWFFGFGRMLWIIGSALVIVGILWFVGSRSK